jgi:putative copper resistance protein D
MLTAQLIVARAANIGASILLEGIFTSVIIMLATAGGAARNSLQDIERRLLRLAVWSLVVALFSALLWFCLEVASVSGLPLASSFSTKAWQTVLFETEFGRVSQLRLGLIATAFALAALCLAQAKARRALILILWLLSVGLLVSLAWISHAAATRAHRFGLLGDCIHLCAAGVWIGGLVPLVIFLAGRRGLFPLYETVVPILHRFSTLSLYCVSVIIVSGISNSWLVVGSVHALFTTPYGRLLLVKLTLFAILVAFGLRNRFLIKAKLLKAPAVPDLVPQVRRNVLCEICFGAAVVAIVACLGVTPPAGHS